MSTTEPVRNAAPPTRMRHHQAPELPDDVPSPTRKSWAILCLALVAQILVVLDISVVNTALPSLGADLGLTGGAMQWVVTAYLLTSGGCLLLGGRLADLLPRRAVLVAGMAMFTGASLVCGLAGSAGVLIGARAIQGVGAARNCRHPDPDRPGRQP
jgi:MFS family permease